MQEQVQTGTDGDEFISSFGTVVVAAFAQSCAEVS